MNLREVTAPLESRVVAGALDAEVVSIAYDSRKVGRGTCFVALRGAKVDGHQFIDQAIADGATAIVAESAPPDECSVPWVHVSDTRKALALMAAAFYGRPGDQLAVAGVTGTNGKTTIAFLLHYLTSKAQQRCGLIGTIYYDLGGNDMRWATHTTPESLELHRYMKAMVSNGCRALVMEVSSHALDQARVHGVDFRAGIFTNLSQDHLDYHETMERYFEAKCILFEKIAAQKQGRMIINGDDLWGRKLAQRFEGTGKVVRYGFATGCDLQATNVRYDMTGTQFELTAKGRQFLVRTPLIGDFNVYNSLAAIAAADAMGLNFREAITNLVNAPQVPGRLERVSDNISKYHIFVDYAHTPDALVNVLKALRALRPNRIITVFGCGGDRDRTKRPLMARAAELGSDICILTSDNPRNEDPELIMADARKGFGGKNHALIVDRAEAIKTAVAGAQQFDIVLIAGKGHEDYQEIKGVKHRFEDGRVARGAMFARRDAVAQTRLDRQIMSEERERWEREHPARQTFDDTSVSGEDGPQRRWNA